MKIYLDENLPPALASGLNELEKANRQGIEVLSIKDAFGQGIADEDWIPKVGQEGGVVITADHRIQRIRSQRELYQIHKVGIFFFQVPKGGLRYWEIVKVLVDKWPKITEKALGSNRPFAFRFTRRGQQFENLG
jgi:hypothetical protein